jgi:hypothetical protein
MIEPSLAGCWVKLERADEQLKSLYREWETFLDTKPYTGFIDPKLDGEWMVLRHRVFEDPPPRWSATVGEVVHDLRSCLDNLVWQLVQLNECVPTGRNQMPICDRPDGPGGFTDKLWQLKGVSDPHIECIKRLQPYSRGNRAPLHPLSVLRELSNADKHRALHAVIATHRIAESLRFVVLPAPLDFTVDFILRDGPVKDGAEIGRVRFPTEARMEKPVGWSEGDPLPEPKVYMEGNLSTRIAFGKCGMGIRHLKWIGASVVEVLERFAGDF